jgi:deoxyadenosine/deoxycytidine kinase
MNYTIEIISIEGNIGSGKSTLLDNLKKQFDKNDYVTFLREPVYEWSNIKDENGVTMLEKFYENQEKYSFPFQMMAYISRLKLLKDTFDEITTKIQKIKSFCSDFDCTGMKPKKFIIITERSLYTDKMVFAKMLYDTKKIEHINYQIYINWFDTFSKEFPVDKIIYVKADPETCHQRINVRNREGENNISIEYLYSCNQYHDKMLDKKSSECVCNNQLILNGNDNIYDNEYILSEWIQTIKDFIKF